jgi:transcriptional regulator with GAF, ATPase, and Fis domain
VRNAHHFKNHPAGIAENDFLSTGIRLPPRAPATEVYLPPARQALTHSGPRPSKQAGGAPDFIAASPATRDLLNRLQAIASSHVPVLIMGETGTGKELLARAVHATSNRRDRLFNPFNCATLNRETAESQIFGHKRGSFTGALSDHPGVIRAAEGGTLFLDEIGELSLELQPKLLRFLQEGEVHPVGATGPVKTDARVVAATNRDLEEESRAGRFRQDLFHRLKVIQLRIPPLRERREEIPPLIECYLDRYRVEFGKPDLQLSGETFDLLTRYDWPGNVRELCHELQRLTLYAVPGRLVEADQLDPAIRQQPGKKSALASKIRLSVDGDVTLAEAVSELERQLIARALSNFRGNLTRAARSLELTNKGLRDKIRRLEIDRAGRAF